MSDTQDSDNSKPRNEIGCQTELCWTEDMEVVKKSDFEDLYRIKMEWNKLNFGKTNMDSDKLTVQIGNNRLHNFWKMCIRNYFFSCTKYTKKNHSEYTFYKNYVTCLSVN